MAKRVFIDPRPRAKVHVSQQVTKVPCDNNAHHYTRPETTA